jgi:glycosyltransferase 2 family protein
MGGNKQLGLIVRVGAGVTLIALMLRMVGWSELLEHWERFHAGWYAVAVGLIFAHYLLQSIMLRIILKPHDIHTKARRIFRLMIVSNFFGIFLPGGIGPDMVLCYNMARSSEKKEHVLSAVIFMRIAVLFIMSCTALAFSFHPAADAGTKLATALIVCAFIAYYVVMANQHTLAMARYLLQWLNRYAVTRLLYKTYFALSDHGKDLRRLGKILPFLVASAIIKIITDYYVALALGIDIPLLYFFIFIPVITLIAAIPLTFAGLGVREGSFMGFFALAGVPADEALAISLLSFTLVILTAAIGGVLYVAGGVITQQPPPSTQK